MYKKLLSSLREFRTDTLHAPIFVSIESIVEVLIPLLMASMIDNGIRKGNIKFTLWLGLGLICLALISLWMGILAGKCAARASAGLSANLRTDMFAKVQSFSFSNLDRFSTASLITRLTTDVTNVQNSYQMIIRLGVRSPMMILCAVLFSFSIDVKLSTIFVIVLPILGATLLLLIHNVHPVFVRVFRRYDTLNNIVQENLLGIRVVKSYTREEHEREKFGEVSHKIFRGFIRAAMRISVNMPLMQLCMYITMLFLSWFGAQQILASGNNADLGLSTGELTSLVTYAIQCLMHLVLLSQVFIMFIVSRASVERIVEVLDEESTLKSPENPVLEVPDGSIVFDNVRFAYSEKAAKLVLDGINLTIASGETVGILGGTGSAKSSLVQLIPRLYDATEGVVRVGGQDVREYDTTVLRNSVAMVLQKNVLFSGTIKENLRWGNEAATDEEIWHVCRLAQAEHFINELPDGYESHVEQGGTNFSGGQRQRLCIARALLKNPKILILDDSTSAVDTKTDELIRTAFKSYIPNTTKIIIAQRVASVSDANKIIVMDSGKISAVGTHDELLETSEIYREVHDSQVRGGGLNG